MNRNDKCNCGSNLKYKKCCGKPKPILTLEQQMNTYKSGYFEDYKLKMNMAHLVACIADGYAMEADMMLSKCGYALENKDYFSDLKNTLKKLLKKVDGMPDSDRADAFLMCINRTQEVFNAMSKKNISEEEHVKLLSYIQNNIKDGE